MKYLFYDCEAANSYNKISKICSLGYVLCDEKFNILKKEDILINPESFFDSYLFKKDSEINLHYKKNEFYNSKTFNEKYEYIKEIFTKEDIIVFGFSILNDIKYLIDACNRYNKEIFNFLYYDVQTIFKCFKQSINVCSLEAAYKDLNLELNEILCHKSDDDAYLTMRVLEGVLKKENCTFNELLDKYKISSSSVSSYLEEQYKRIEIKRKKQEKYNERCRLLKELNNLYDKKCDECIDVSLFDNKYTFSKGVLKEPEKAIDLQKYIFYHGGMTYRNYDTGRILVVTSDDDIETLKNNNINFVNVNSLIK